MRNQIYINHHKIKFTKSASFRNIQSIKISADNKYFYLRATNKDIMKYDVSTQKVIGNQIFCSLVLSQLAEAGYFICWLPISSLFRSFNIEITYLKMTLSFHEEAK